MLQRGFLKMFCIMLLTLQVIDLVESSSAAEELSSLSDRLTQAAHWPEVRGYKFVMCCVVFSVVLLLCCFQCCVLYVLSYLALPVVSCRVVSFLVLSCFACLVLSFLALSCLALLVLSCLVLPCLALPCLALPCLALPCLALPCLALPCLVLSCLVLSCLVLSCFALPCLITPRVVSFCYALLSLISNDLLSRVLSCSGLVVLVVLYCQCGTVSFLSLSIANTSDLAHCCP